MSMTNGGPPAEGAANQAPPSLTMSELSERLMVSNGNLTGLVGRLAREGLVRRSASPTDARAQLVSLTAAGRRAEVLATDMGRGMDARGAPGAPAMSIAHALHLVI